jgi:hypothetical protein
MAVTLNYGLALYEGPATERPNATVDYLNAFYRATDTGAFTRCVAKGSGYQWEAVSPAMLAQINGDDGDTIGNTDVKTFFETVCPLGANVLKHGDVIKIVGAFEYGSKASGPGTLELTLEIADGILLLVTAHTLPDNASGHQIVVTAYMTVTVTGVHAAVEVSGTAINAGSGAVWACAPGAGGDDFSSLVDKSFKFSAKFSLADVANTISQKQFIFELIER